MIVRREDFMPEYREGSNYHMVELTMEAVKSLDLTGEASVSSPSVAAWFAGDSHYEVDRLSDKRCGIPGQEYTLPVWRVSEKG